MFDETTTQQPTSKSQQPNRKPGTDASHIERVAWLKDFFMEFNRTEQVTQELRRLPTERGTSMPCGDGLTRSPCFLSPPLQSLSSAPPKEIN